MTLLPIVWCQGSHSTWTGASGDDTSRLPICNELAIMRWVLSTPLGRPVEPDVKRIFATASQDTAREASVNPSPPVRDVRARKGTVSGAPSTLIQVAAASSGIERPAEKSRQLWTKTKFGRNT